MTPKRPLQQHFVSALDSGCIVFLTKPFSARSPIEPLIGRLFMASLVDALFKVCMAVNGTKREQSAYRCLLSWVERTCRVGGGTSGFDRGCVKLGLRTFVRRPRNVGF